MLPSSGPAKRPLLHALSGACSRQHRCKQSQKPASQMPCLRCEASPSGMNHCRTSHGSGGGTFAGAAACAVLKHGTWPIPGPHTWSPKRCMHASPALDCCTELVPHDAPNSPNLSQASNSHVASIKLNSSFSNSAARTARSDCGWVLSTCMLCCCKICLTTLS